VARCAREAGEESAWTVTVDLLKSKRGWFLCSSHQPFPGCSDLSRDTCPGSCYQCCNMLQKLQDNQVSPPNSPQPGTIPVPSRGGAGAKSGPKQNPGSCGHLGTRPRAARRAVSDSRCL